MGYPSANRIARLLRQRRGGDCHGHNAPPARPSTDFVRAVWNGPTHGFAALTIFDACLEPIDVTLLTMVGTPDPLIKSQGQSGPVPNIDKKARLFRGPLAFSFDNGRRLFCPGSTTERAQPKTQRSKIDPHIAGGLCRY